MDIPKMMKARLSHQQSNQFLSTPTNVTKEIICGIRVQILPLKGLTVFRHDFLCQAGFEVNLLMAQESPFSVFVVFMRCLYIPYLVQPERVYLLVFMAIDIESC
jgi:hypothetical protein